MNNRYNYESESDDNVPLSKLKKGYESESDDNVPLSKLKKGYESEPEDVEMEDAFEYVPLNVSESEDVEMEDAFEDEKQYLWVSHGSHVNGTFTKPINVNIIFLVRVGLMCLNNTYNKEIMNYTISNKFEENIFKDQVSHRNKESSIRNRVIYREYREVPNLKLSWGEADLNNEKFKDYKFGLSNLPIGKHKKTGTIFEKFEKSAASTLKELATYVSNLDLRKTHNIFIMACRGSTNIGRDAGEINKLIKFENNLLPHLSLSKLEFLADDTNSIYDIWSMNNYNFIDGFNDQIKDQVISIYNECFQQSTQERIDLHDSMINLIYQVKQFNVVVLGFVCISNSMHKTVLDKINSISYKNKQKLKKAYYIHSVCINKDYRGMGMCDVLFSRLSNNLNELLKNKKISNKSISLIVRNNNMAAKKCYSKNYFKPSNVFLEWHDGKNEIYTTN